MTSLRVLTVLSCLALAAACEPPPDDPTSPPADDGTGGGEGGEGGDAGAGGGGDGTSGGGGADAPGGGDSGGGSADGGGGGSADGGGGDGGAGSGGGSGGGGDGGSGSDDGDDDSGSDAGGSAVLTLSIEPGDAPPGAGGIDLDVAGVALFAGEPSWRNADTPCDAGQPGALVLLTTRVEVPFGGGRVPVVQLEVPAGGEVREAWLMVRHGALRTAERTYEVHAGPMCLMPDGFQYVRLRARPGLVPLDGTREIALELGREQLRSEQVDCGASPAVEECATSDDGTDDDPATRLRYEFGPELPARAVE